MPNDPVIPSAFIRSDTRITDADQCVNARDLQTFVENYNMLIARRIRQPALALSMSSDGDSAPAGELAQTYKLGIKPLTRLSAPTRPWVAARVYIPAWCQTCTLAVRAKEADVTNDAVLYPVLGRPGEMGEASAAESITVTSTTMTKYTTTVTVPESLRNWGWLQFTLFATTPILTSDSITGDPINAVGPDYVDSVPAGSTASQYDLLYVTDSGGTARDDIAPKVITSVVQQASGRYRYTVDQAWEVLPNPGAEDKVNVRTINSVSLASLVLTPDSISDPFVFA